MHKIKVFAVFIGVMSLVCLGSGRARAQATWGSINGFVSDASGAMIPAASISVTEERTGVVTKGVTDASGLYNITHLLPGEYSVSVEMEGFKHFTQQHVTLQVDSTVRVDCVLELGSVSQKVTVEGAAPQLQVEKTDVARNINERAVE